MLLNSYLIIYTTKDECNGYAIINAKNPKEAELILIHNGIFKEKTYKIVSITKRHLPPEDNSIVALGITTPGASAYELAVANGFNGSLEEWLASLKGTIGPLGQNGKSAYEIAVDNGFIGTLEEWIQDLKGNYLYITEYNNNLDFSANYICLGLNNENSSIKEFNTEVFVNASSFIYNGNSVATYDMIPTRQTSYSDAVNRYINSDGYTDSNKCALSAKNTTILQGTKGTWSEGKLLFRKGRWGDDGYSTIAIPTATTEFDGLLSKEDKAKVDNLSNEWYGTQEEFDALIKYQEGVNYYIY